MGSAGVRSLGRYELLQHFASGGMADVYLARSSGLEGFVRHVVVKRIRAQDARDSQYVKMFLDEARLAASLHHQHVVQVHDVGHENDEYFLAMEYVHGKDARALLVSATQRKEHLPFEHVVGIIAAAAAGLHYAHEQVGPDRQPLGLVHRDVSPSNILIGYDGAIKVADFGIAKAAHRSGHTASGTFKGKIAYMSPEQCRGKQADRRSDIFALGVVLYELVTARRLFKAESDYLTMSGIVSGSVPSATKFRPDVPPELNAIMMKALAVAPEDRYQTADEMRRALEQFAAGAGLRTSTTALADFMKEVFGVEAEPWHAEGGIPPHAPSLHDDTSGSGLSYGPELDFSDVSDVAPDSPLARARRHPITSPPSVDEDAPPLRLSGSLQIPVPRTTGSYEPLTPPPRPRRWIWGVAAGAVALIAIAIVAVASSGGGGAAAAPTPPPPEPAPVVATPPPPPPAPPPAAVSVDAAPEVTVAAPVADKPKPAPKPTKPVVKPKPKPQPTDPDWDRKSLFPK